MVDCDKTAKLSDQVANFDGNAMMLLFLSRAHRHRAERLPRRSGSV